MPGPWEADAPTYFGEDPEVLAAFDRYMTEKQQPYVTQLEEETKPARELWARLNDENRVEDAVKEIVGSVYENDTDFLSAFDGLFVTPTVTENPPPPVVEPTAEEPPSWAKPLVEDYQTRRDRQLAETQAADYAEFKTGLKESHGLTDDDLELIDPFIAVSAHDVDAAVAKYRAWEAKRPPAAVEPPPLADPPPVVGGEGSTSATPPLAPKYTKYSDIGDALRNHLSQQRVSATPPPVVG